MIILALWERSSHPHIKNKKVTLSLAYETDWHQTNRQVGQNIDNSFGRWNRGGARPWSPEEGNSPATPHLDSLPGSHFPTGLRRPEPRVSTMVLLSWRANSEFAAAKVAGICRAKPQRRRNYRMGVWMVSPEFWTEHWAVLLVREGKTAWGLPESAGLRTEKWRDVRGLATLEDTGGPASTQCKDLNTWRHLRHSADEGPLPRGRSSLPNPTESKISESHTEMGFGGWSLPSQRDFRNPLGFPQTLEHSVKPKLHKLTEIGQHLHCWLQYKYQLFQGRWQNPGSLHFTTSGLQSNLPDTQGSKATWPRVNRNQP